MPFGLKTSSGAMVSISRTRFIIETMVVTSERARQNGPS
jgi:hypothetical protein